MNLFEIATKDVLLLLRDRKALLTLLVTPLLLTVILGMAFANMWSAQTPPSLVLWINHDSGEYGKRLFTDAFTVDGIREWTVLEEVTQKDEALQRVRKGKATAFIEIGESFSRDVLKGQAEIYVSADPGSSIRANVITQLVQRFAAELSSRLVIYETLTSQEISVQPQQVEDALAAIKLKTKVEDSLVPAQEQTRRAVPMDYYAAGMGVMYLLFTVSHGATTFLKERSDHTLARMYQSPVAPWKIAAGKFMGIFATGILQLTVIIIFTKLAYGVNWGSLEATIGLALSSAFAASGIGLLIAAVSKTESAASALGSAVVLPMSILGGSMMPLYVLPGLARTLSKLTINGWAMDGFTRIMFDGAGLTDIAQHCLILLAAGFVLIMLAGRILKQRGVAA